MTEWEAEVVVVGAGPAGTAVAAELARRRREVLLVDRGHFPRPKACGECLNPGAVCALERLGLLDAARRACPVPLAGWTLVTPGGRRVRAMFPGSHRALAVDRLSLDRLLLGEARRRGVRVEENVRVTDVAPGAGQGRPWARGRRHDGTLAVLRGSVLIGADGLRSIVARRIGAIRRRPRLRKASLTWRIRARGPSRDRGRLFLGGDMTVGLAPVPDPSGATDRWNATLVVNTDRLRHGLREEAEPLLRRGLEALGLPWSVQAEVCDGPWASGPFDWHAHRVVSERTLLVGDAAGYYDPLTGQGLFRALRGAEVAAAVVDTALPPQSPKFCSTRAADTMVDREVLRRYHRIVATQFAPGRGLQRLIERVVSGTRAREAVMSMLQRWPAATSALLRATGDATHLREARPDFRK